MGDVLAIHRRDVAAGAGAILTNSFRSQRQKIWLRKFGQADLVESINRRAVDLAREAAGPGRFVIGDLGPTAALEEGAAVEQAAILVDAGADALIFETYCFRDAERVVLGVSGSLAAPIPLLASLWGWPDPAGPAARRLLDAWGDRGWHELPGRHRGRARFCGAAGRASAMSATHQTQRGHAGPA